MNLIQIREHVRAKAGVKGSGLSSLIDRAFIEVCDSMTAKNRMPELLQSLQTVSPVSSGIPTFVLPALIQHLVNPIKLSVDGSADLVYGVNINKPQGMNTGDPRSYYRSGINLLLYPYVNLTTSSVITFDYYKRIRLVDINADIFPSETLLNVVLLMAASNVAGYTDSKRAAILKGEARDLLTDINAEQDLLGDDL